MGWLAEEFGSIDWIVPAGRWWDLGPDDPDRGRMILVDTQAHAEYPSFPLGSDYLLTPESEARFKEAAAEIIAWTAILQPLTQEDFRRVFEEVA